MLRNPTARHARPGGWGERPRARELLRHLLATTTIAKRIAMDTIERLYAPTAEPVSSEEVTGAIDRRGYAIALPPIELRPGTIERPFSWVMHLLPPQRRKAVYALYTFCCEVDDIADGEASPSLKQILLMSWRSEIACLYGGRPRHAVTIALTKAIHLYGLRCHDFLAIIDGAEMKALSDIRATTIAQLERYCE